MEALNLAQLVLMVCLLLMVLTTDRIKCNEPHEPNCGDTKVCGHGTTCMIYNCKCDEGYDEAAIVDSDSLPTVIYCFKKCSQGDSPVLCGPGSNTTCRKHSSGAYKCMCLEGYSRSHSTGQCLGGKTTSTSTDFYQQTTTASTILATVTTTAVPPVSQTLTIALAVGLGGAVLLAIVIALVVVLRRRWHAKASGPTDIPHLRDLEGRTNTSVTPVHDYQSVFDPPLTIDRNAPSDPGVNLHARNHQHGFNPYEDVDDPTPYDTTDYSANAQGMPVNNQHIGGIPVYSDATKNQTQIAKAKETPMKTYSNHTITANKAMQKKHKELKGAENPGNAYHTAEDDGKRATNEYDTTYSLFGSKGSNDTSTGGTEKDRRQSGEVLYHELTRPKA